MVCNTDLYYNSENMLLQAVEGDSISITMFIKSIIEPVNTSKLLTCDIRLYTYFFYYQGTHIQCLRMSDGNTNICDIKMENTGDC